MQKNIFTVTIVDAKDEMEFGRHFDLSVRAADVNQAANKALKLFTNRRTIRGSAEELVKRPFISRVLYETTLDD